MMQRSAYLMTNHCSLFLVPTSTWRRRSIFSYRPQSGFFKAIERPTFIPLSLLFPYISLCLYNLFTYVLLLLINYFSYENWNLFNHSYVYNCSLKQRCHTHFFSWAQSDLKWARPVKLLHNSLYEKHPFKCLLSFISAKNYKQLLQMFIFSHLMSHQL